MWICYYTRTLDSNILLDPVNNHLSVGAAVLELGSNSVTIFVIFQITYLGSDVKSQQTEARTTLTLIRRNLCISIVVPFDSGPLATSLTLFFSLPALFPPRLIQFPFCSLTNVIGEFPFLLWWNFILRIYLESFSSRND